MKKSWMTILALLVIWTGVDLSLLFNDKTPFSNQLYRVVSGAPAVHANGQLLMYQGQDQYQDSAYVIYKKSTENLQLYKIKDIPDEQIPPYVFTVHENKDKVYKYSVPHSPFGMR